MWWNNHQQDDAEAIDRSVTWRPGDLRAEEASRELGRWQFVTPLLQVSAGSSRLRGAMAGWWKLTFLDPQNSTTIVDNDMAHPKRACAVETDARSCSAPAGAGWVACSVLVVQCSHCTAVSYKAFSV